MQRREKSVHLLVVVDCNLSTCFLRALHAASCVWNIFFTVVGPSSVSCVNHVGGD
jgi:hypothetical protein